MTFQPLFFLPRRALRWAYDQAYAEHLMDTPFAALFITIDRGGIWFPYKGDEVLWTWPWRRKGLAPFISIAFSGTGDFGDASFRTLKEIDNLWEAYHTACEAAELMDGMELAGEVKWENGQLIATAAEDVHAGDLVAIDENSEVVKDFARNAGMSPVEVARLANEMIDKLGSFPHDEMERIGKAFDNIDKRT